MLVSVRSKLVSVVTGLHLPINNLDTPNFIVKIFFVVYGTILL